MKAELRINHLYDFPELYETIYHRPDSYKLAEAYAFAYIVERTRPKAESLIELLSGKVSKHKRYFQDAHSTSDLRYICTDGTADTSGDVVHIRNIVNAQFQSTFDVATAHYYSPSSVCDMDNGGLVTPELTQGFIQTAYNALNPGGIFIMDFAVWGYEVATDTDCELTNQVRKESNYVDFNSPLSKWLRANGHSISPQDDVSIVSKVASRYDRMTSNNMDTYESIHVLIGERTVLTVKVKNPFCQRYFSEPELVDMFRRAGFTNIDFWNSNYLEHNYQKLSSTLAYASDVEDEDEDTRHLYTPNVLVGFK